MDDYIDVYLIHWWFAMLALDKLGYDIYLEKL